MSLKVSNFYDQIENENGGITIEPTEQLLLLHIKFRNLQLRFASQTNSNDFNKKPKGLNLLEEDTIAPEQDQMPNINKSERHKYVYSIKLSPQSNNKVKHLQSIVWQQKEWKFDGFFVLSHVRLAETTNCNILRFGQEYRLKLVEENINIFYTWKDLDLFFSYLFEDVMQISSFDFNKAISTLPGIQMMPHFKRKTKHGSTCVLPMYAIIDYIITNQMRLDKIPEATTDKKCFNQLLEKIVFLQQENCKSIRVDNINLERRKGKDCLMISYLNDIIPRKRKISESSKSERIFSQRYSRIDTTVIAAKKCLYTGLCSSICQDALLIPAMIEHLQIHFKLQQLQNQLNYTFENLDLLQVAMTHISRCRHYGANFDEIEVLHNRLGTRFFKEHRNNDEKRWYCKIKDDDLSYQEQSQENSNDLKTKIFRWKYNETLEFLGDAVLDLICSTKLFKMFPNKNEGKLSLFRSSLVLNTHLTNVAKSFQFEKFILIDKRSCTEEHIDAFLANCVEAVIGSVFLDSGWNECETLVERLMFNDNHELLKVWSHDFQHPLQILYPNGDRHLIDSHPVLKNLVALEDSIGFKFKNISLVAKAMTHALSGFNLLTMGNNQRLEFLGDSVMKFLVTEFVFQSFPSCNEGQLSDPTNAGILQSYIPKGCHISNVCYENTRALRSSLVNAACQAKVALELGLNIFIDYGIHGRPKKASDKLLADVLEAFVAAVYIDGGINYCRTLLRVCLFPKLKGIISSRQLIDSKSLLQQKCLLMASGTSNRYRYKPIYRTLKTSGCADDHIFKVAVYVDGKRMACSSGKSIQEAQTTAATEALNKITFLK